MADHEHGAETPDEPLAEIAGLRVDANPDLAGRVRRDINRRTLAADSLDFSLNIMLQTFWEHLRSAIDAWPGARPADAEDKE